MLSKSAYQLIGPLPTILGTYPQAVIPAIVRAGGEGGGFGLVVVGAFNNVTVVKVSRRGGGLASLPCSQRIVLRRLDCCDEYASMQPERLS